MFIRSVTAAQQLRFFRAKTAYNDVKEKLKKGSGSIPNPDPKVVARVSFIRCIANRCDSLLAAEGIATANQFKQKHTDADLYHKTIYDIILRNLLSEIYEVGNCGELSDAALVHYIENGIDESLEYISLQGVDPQMNHPFVVANSEKKSDSHSVKNWKAQNDALLVIDPWLNNLGEYPNKKIPDEHKLFKQFAPVDTLITRFRIEKNLTATEFDRIINVLGKLKKNITVEFLDKIIKEKGFKFITADEHAKIMAKIDEKIAVYAACKVEHRATMSGSLVVKENYFAAKP